MAIDWIIRKASSDADLERIAELRAIAFDNDNDFLQALQPRIDTPQGRASVIKEIRRQMREDPTALFMVVEHPETKEVVCHALWNYYPKGDPGQLYNWEYLKDFEGADWMDEEKVKFLAKSFFEARREAIRVTNGPCMLLNILCTDPAWHRKGAGLKAVRWGLDIADRDGIESFVEASPVGKHLYETTGFIAEKQYTLDLPAEKNWGTSPKPGPLQMRRPITKKDNASP